MDHSHLTEFDYLKQIVLAYMTGTDRLVCLINFIGDKKNPFSRQW